MKARGEKGTKGAVLLTEGAILPGLVRFALPVLVGQLLQTLYNSVDSIVVGRCVGTGALAAVTASATITNFFVGFFTGLATGASVLFARHFGAKKYGELSDTIHTAVTFSILLGIAIALAGFVLAPFLLNVVACPADVYGDALLYLRIYMLGAFFMSLYNVGSGVLRSVGDSRGPFLYLLTASCFNIVLDVVFVVWFRMGVAGVAVATCLAQFTSVALSFRKMMLMDMRYRFSFRRMGMKGALLKEIIHLGLPAGIQSSIMSISNMYVQYYINRFSPAAIAGIGSAMKIDQYAGMPCNALGLSMTTYIGQNIGAGKPERARKGIALSFAAVVIIVAVVGTVAYFFAEPLLGIFSADPEVITYGVGMLHVIMPVYLVMGFQMLFSGVLRGYGYSVTTMVMSVMGMVVIRQIWLAVTLNIDYSIRFIYWGYPVSWAATSVMLLFFYLAVIRRKYDQTNKEE